MKERKDNERIVYDEPHLTIGLREAEHQIHLRWHGHARSDQYRSGLDLALTFVHQYGVRLWLADLREMTAILRPDEQWANEVWFPKLFGTGLEKMAILRSRDYFNDTSVQRSFTAVNGKVTFKVAWFATQEEAMEWLERREAASA
jgi:hypothetical protein